MIVYNITTKVAHHFVPGWLSWMQQVYLPRLTESGLFQSCELHRLLDQEDDEGETFVAQCRAVSREDYELFAAQYADALRQQGHERFGRHVISFHTLMEPVG